MFIGEIDVTEISLVPVLATDGMQFVIYLVHFFAVFLTASAVILAFGSRLVRRLHLKYLPGKHLNLIYGVNEDTLRFGSALIQEKKGRTVFVGESQNETDADRILEMGSILFDGDNALTGGVSFLKAIGLRSGTQRLSVYCLSGEDDKNLQYAVNLRDSLEKAGIKPDQTRLTLMTASSEAGERLQAVVRKGEEKEDRLCYGYGSVLALERQVLAARMMIRQYPPYKTLEFSKDGSAVRDFRALIVGFGPSGQAALRVLAANAQFTGSRFAATVAAEDPDASAGLFLRRYRSLLTELPVSFLNTNCKSTRFYDFLLEEMAHLNYVAVCLDSEAESVCAAREITLFLRETGSRAAVAACFSNGVQSFGAEGLPRRHDLYTTEILCGDTLDRMAMAINHKYQRDAHQTTEEDWLSCDYFSRQSCRASTDFTEAMLASAGRTKEEIVKSGWPDDPVLMENLARTEHLRWCAFHYAQGYRPMTAAAFDERGAAYKEEVRTRGASKIRISKDTVRKEHACLIPWEELEALNQREAAYTGIHKDYQQMDLDNVLIIPELLQETE